MKANVYYYVVSTLVAILLLIGVFENSMESAANENPFSEFETALFSRDYKLAKQIIEIFDDINV